MPIFENIPTRGVPIHVFTDTLVANARKQLVDLAESGIAEEFVAAMPDVHFGLGATIGSVFASTWAVCPNAVGVDIGCGMAAVPFPGLLAENLDSEKKWTLHRRIKASIPTGMQVHRQDQWAPVLDDLARTPWLSAQLNGRALRMLGTLGGGNHFIEIVHDPSGQVWAMLHSGSRNLGKITADRYNDLAKRTMAQQGKRPHNPDLNYLRVDSSEGQDYLLDMNWCQRFALANRQAMLEILGRLIEEETNVSPDWTGMVNIHHNFCSLENCGGKEYWITRKGATSAREWQKGLIPGSMAVGSWLVEGLGNPASWYSCSHGAGRNKSRTASFAEISQQSFEAAMTGIVAETVPELRDEAPQAYKNLDSVMACQSDLVKPVLRLLPLVNVKGWDPGGTSPWKIDKVKASFQLPEDWSMTIAWVETQEPIASGKHKALWVDAKDYEQRPLAPGAAAHRDIWVRTLEDPTRRTLLTGEVAASSEAGVVIRVSEVKRKEKLA